MSNAKTWETHQRERKETKSIYLTTKDWEYLHKKGNGSPTHFIREMIEQSRLNTDITEDNKSNS
jgi:hypothetical protein